MPEQIDEQNTNTKLFPTFCQGALPWTTVLPRLTPGPTSCQEAQPCTNFLSRGPTLDKLPVKRPILGPTSCQWPIFGPVSCHKAQPWTKFLSREPTLDQLPVKGPNPRPTSCQGPTWINCQGTQPWTNFLSRGIAPDQLHFRLTFHGGVLPRFPLFFQRVAAQLQLLLFFLQGGDAVGQNLLLLQSLVSLSLHLRSFLLQDVLLLILLLLQAVDLLLQLGALHRV